MTAANAPAYSAGDEATPDPMTHALKLAAEDLAVLPVMADKRPAPGWGVTKATTDPQAIVDAFMATGAPLVGVACGASGIAVVDIDRHEGGANGFASVAARPVALPPTWGHTSTGGEGMHLVYAAPATVAPSKPLPGVDLKAGNGYIVWPQAAGIPSRSAFAPLPADLATERASDGGGEVDPETVSWWTGVNPGPIEEGSRLASALAALPPHGSEQWNDANLVPLALGVVRSAMTCTGGALARDAFVARYAAGEWATTQHRRAAERAFAKAIDSEGMFPILPAPVVDIATGEPVETPPEPRERSFRVLTLSELRNRPRPTWLIDGLIQGAGVVMLAGDGGLGKSFLVVDWAARIATGTPWQGRAVKPGRVLYVLGEGAEFFPDRIDAWQREHGHKIDEDRFHVVDDPFSLSDPANVSDAVDLVAGDGYSLIVLDTLSQLGGIDNENDNAELAKVMRQAKAIRVAHPGATVLVVHHTSKAGSVRGASAIRDNVDTVLVATGTSESFTLSSHPEDGGKMKNAANVREHGFQLRAVAPAAVVARSVVEIDPVAIAVNAVLDRGGEHGIREFLITYGEDSEAASKRIRRYLTSLVERGLAADSGTRQDKRWTRL